MRNIITGIKSTGSSLHLGNLVGAILPFSRVAQGNNAAIFIADLHSLTSVTDGNLLKKQTFEIALEYFALYGLDTPFIIFRQSDIQSITKLMWILTNVTPYSLMLRAHSFKDAKAKRRDINMGTFNYPILMASDIIGYDIDAVPVGKDQIQHLEMARDIASSFNKIYNKKIFIEPEAIVFDNVSVLPGIDGRKMSKSYNNFIGVFDDEELLKKRIMSITTGSEGIHERKKNPDSCTVFNLYKVFATPEETELLRKKYESENIGFGYGHAKQELFRVLSLYLKPYREAREALSKNPEIIEQKLAEGAKIMNARLENKMKIIKETIGIR